MSYPLAERGLVHSGKFARWLRRPCRQASSARYSVQVCEVVLTDLLFVPCRLSNYRPSSQEARGAPFEVAGMPRPRTERQSSSGGTSIVIMVYSLRTRLSHAHGLAQHAWAARELLRHA